MKVMMPEFSFLGNIISFCKHGIVLKVLHSSNYVYVLIERNDMRRIYSIMVDFKG